MLTHATACARTLELWWTKKVRNLGMRTLRGLLRVSESSISAESSQIFSSAPNAPSHSAKSELSSFEQSEGKSSAQLKIVPLLAMVVIRMPMVALIKGEGSPTAWRHPSLRWIDTSGGNWWKCALTLFLRMRPDKARVASDSLLSLVSTCSR